MSFRLSLLTVIAVVALASCSSSKGEESDDGGSNPIPFTVGSGGTAAVVGHSGGNANFVIPNAGDSGVSAGSRSGGGGPLRGTDALANCSPAVCATVASPGPVCASEVCDGLDNDCNGIIDDVDTGNDGICDCIKIATLGTPGTWGEGNVFGAWLSARSTNGATSLGAQVLTTQLLTQFDIVIVQNVNAQIPSDGSGGIGRSYSQEEVAALANFVTGRGGLMTMTGYSDSSERTNVNALLASVGLNYGSDPILKQRDGRTLAVTNWFQHPTTTNIKAVGTDNGYESQSDLNLGTIVATQDGYVVGRALEAGAGRVFQWGDEWITYDSEWTQHPDYQVELFWLNIIKWLSPKNYCQVSIPPVLIN